MIVLFNSSFKRALHGFLFIFAATLFVACGASRSTSSTPQLPDVEKRRASYYVMDALNKQLQGKKDEAYMLYKHAVGINPHEGAALYYLGLYSLQLDSTRQCEDYLTRAVNAEPGNVDYMEALASLYLRCRNNEKATKVLENMVKCAPDRTDVLAQLVSLYIEQENYSSAIKALDRIEMFEGRNMAISMQKFRLYREQDQSDSAFVQLERLAKDNPNDLSYRVLIGDQYMMCGDTATALDYYEQVRKKEPRNQALRMTMLDYYHATHQDSLFREQLDDLLYAPDIEERVRVALMRNYVIDREAVQADSTEILSTFRKVIARQNPPSVEFLSLYASYLQLKKMDAPLEDVLEQIIQLENDNQPALYQLVKIAIQRNDYDRVTKVCARAIEHYPDELPFYFYQGFSYYQLDKPALALEAFKKGAKQIKPDTDVSLVSDLYSITGDLYHANGFKDSAYAAYDSCLAYKPDNVGCLNNYAYYLSLDGKELDKAEEMSRRTIQAEPHNKIYLDTYAWVLFVKGKFAQAKIYIDQAVESAGETDDAEISAGMLEHAGDIYAHVGDLKTALQYWQKAKAKGGDVTKVLDKKISLKKYIAP